MARRKSSRQIAAAKRNLIKARAARRRHKSAKMEKYGNYWGFQSSGRPITRAQINNRATRARRRAKVINTAAAVGVVAAFYGPSVHSGAKRAHAKYSNVRTKRKFNKLVYGPSMNSRNSSRRRTR